MAPWRPGGTSGTRRSNTTVTSSPVVLAEASSSSINRRAALWGLFHHPSGRDPMTLDPSTSQRVLEVLDDELRIGLPSRSPDRHMYPVLAEPLGVRGGQAVPVGDRAPACRRAARLDDCVVRGGPGAVGTVVGQEHE